LPQEVTKSTEPDFSGRNGFFISWIDTAEMVTLQKPKEKPKEKADDHTKLLAQMVLGCSMALGVCVETEELSPLIETGSEPGADE
jgi:hypothetical protein